MDRILDCEPVSNRRMMRIEESMIIPLPTDTHLIREAINLTTYALFDRRDDLDIADVALESGRILRVAQSYVFAPETLKIKLTTARDTVTIFASVEIH
jgi:hypothetical protein